MKTIILISLFTVSAFAQFVANGFEPEDDLNVGGDIFSDFNEDLEAAKQMEDERFYRYGRFVNFHIGLGFTSFTGNRGIAYEDDNPSFGLGLTYFLDFQNAFVLGFQYSRHRMFINTFVNQYPNEVLGAVETQMLRPYFGYRYYVDTSDLGTALTYSNPYVVGRVEYWYQTNTFRNRDIDDDAGGNIGTSLGFGFEFPIEIKETYLNAEFLYHFATFFDELTQDYRQIPDNPDSTGGFNDLRGNVLSLFFSYTISW